MLAPQDEPARRLSRLFRDVTLAQRESVYCLYASCRSSFTLKYVGEGLCRSGVHPGSEKVCGGRVMSKWSPSR